MASARVQRWAFLLSGFNYTIEYIKGKINEADELSRIPQYESKEEVVANNFVNYTEQHNYLNLTFKEIAKETRRVHVCSKVMQAIKEGKINELTGEYMNHTKTNHVNCQLNMIAFFGNIELAF